MDGWMDGGSKKKRKSRNKKEEGRGGMCRVDISAQRVRTVRTVTKLGCSQLGELGNADTLIRARDTSYQSRWRDEPRSSWGGNALA